MPSEFHAILKAYCAFVDKTMSEVILDFAKAQVHPQSRCCSAVQNLFDIHEITPDPRYQKPCFGFRCLYCKHETLCRTGLEDKLFIMAKKWHTYLKPSHRYILDFDGSAVDVCFPDQVFNKVNYKTGQLEKSNSESPDNSD